MKNSMNLSTKRINKGVSILIVVIMILALLPTGVIARAEIIDSGTCGDNLTWKLDDEGHLTISGMGDMTVENTGPWGHAISSVEFGNGITSISGFAQCKYITSVILPDSVSRIDSYAFCGCSGLRSITISNSATEIKQQAFQDCINLTELDIPNSVKSIGVSAFDNCIALARLTIGKGMISIGVSAFNGCTSLTSVSIPENVVNIGGSAFFGCTSLTSITIPDCVMSIGSDAFNQTGYYNDIDNWENDVLYIGNYLINAKSGISGDYPIKQGTIGVAEGAFYGCTELTGVSIPDSVIWIDAGFNDTAFYKDVSNWKDNTLYIDNWIISVNSSQAGRIYINSGSVGIAGSAFRDCKKITEVIIPSTVNSIGRGAFVNCEKLTSVSIPFNQVIIGAFMFYGCSNLKSITIPNGVRYIGNQAFRYCNNNLNITIPSSVELIDNYLAFGGYGGVGNTKFNVYKNSYALEYAQANGIAYSIMPPYEMSISRLPDKLQYLENKETIDLTGGLVTLYYGDGTSEEINLNECSISGFDNRTVGKQMVTANYRDLYSTFEIEIIAKTLTGIEITQCPYKTTYIESKGGIETTGGIITLYYNNDTTERKNITPDMVSGFAITKIGKQTLTVTYGDFNDTFEVEVVPKSLTGIVVTTLPNKTAYLEGKDALDITDGKLTLYYDNDTSEEIALAVYMVSGFDNSVVGIQEIIVSYEGFSTSFNVEVIAKALSGIAIAEQPTKRQYLEAKDQLDVSGGRIMLLYNNDSVETIDIEADMVQGFDNTKVGKQKLVVAYGDFTDEYEVEIIAKSITGIEVATLPYKTVYLEVKDEFEARGGKIKIYYNNDTNDTIDITADMISGFDNSRVGKQSVTVSYGGFADAFEIEIITKSLSRIAVTKLPDKTSYLEGKENLDVSGGIMTFFYNNDTSVEAYMIYSNGYKAMLADSGDFIVIGISGFSNKTGGACPVKVEYEKFSTYFEVTIVEKEVSGISIVSAPNKTEYEIGDKIDISGCLINVSYNNDLVRSAYLVYIAGMYRIVFDDTLASDIITISGYDGDVVGTHAINVIYKGFSDTFEVEVNSEKLKGDADGDDEITVADALIVLRVAAKLSTATPELIECCDTDGDREITVIDALAILRVAAKLDDSL